MTEQVKYYPNCLWKCWYSKMLKWYDCEKCEVLLYNTSVVLDSPDLEKQREYKFYNIIKKYWIYHPDTELFFQEMKDLFHNECIWK